MDVGNCLLSSVSAISYLTQLPNPFKLTPSHGFYRKHLATSNKKSMLFLAWIKTSLTPQLSIHGSLPRPGTGAGTIGGAGTTHEPSGAIGTSMLPGPCDHG